MFYLVVEDARLAGEKQIKRGRRGVLSISGGRWGVLPITCGRRMVLSISGGRRGVGGKDEGEKKKEEHP